MEVSEFINYQRPLTPAIDLNIANNAMNTIQQGSEKALEYESELRNAVAQLDLNPQEAEFRQGLIDQIEQATEAGNDVPYYALPDLIKSKGNIFSNPGLIGRLKSQQAYKQYQAQLDADKTLTNDTKERFKELNPYHYEDKIDDNGNVIENAIWTPNMTPVADVSFNDVLKIAQQYMTPDSGQFDSHTFVDANGNRTNGFIPGQTVGVLSDTTGTYERLTPEKIKAAIRAAFNSDPSLNAGMKQGFDNLAWKAEKGKLNTESEYQAYYNPDGVAKTYGQYIDDIIGDYATAHAYNNVVSKTTYHNDALKLIYTTKNKGNGELGIGGGTSKDIFSEAFNSYSAIGDAINVPIEYIRNNTAIVEQGNAAIKQKVYDSFGIDLKEVPSTVKDLQIAIDNSLEGPLSPNQKIAYNAILNSYKDILDKYGSEYEYINNIKNQNSTKADASNVVLNYLTNGYSLNNIAGGTNENLNNNIKDWSNFVNMIYGNEDTIKFTFNNNDNFIRAISSYTPSELENIGIRMKDNSIYIDKTNNENLYKFAGIIGGSKGKLFIGHDKNDIHNEESYKPLKGNADVRSGVSTNRFNNFLSRFGNYPGVVDSPIPIERTYNSTDFYSAVNSQLNKLRADIVDEEINNPNKFQTFNTRTMPGVGIDDVTLDYYVRITGDSDYKNRLAKTTDTLVKTLKQASVVNMPLFVLNGTNGYDLERSVANKAQIQEELRNPNTKIVPYIDYIPGMGYRNGIQYTAPVYDIEKDTDLYNQSKTVTRTVIYGDYIDGSGLEEINQLPSVQGYNRLISAATHDIPITVGKTNDIHYQLKAITDPNQIEFSDQFKLLINGSENTNGRNIILNSSEAQQLSELWDSLIYSRSHINETNAKDIVNNFIGADSIYKTLGESIFGPTSYERIVTYGLGGEQKLSEILSKINK